MIRLTHAVESRIRPDENRLGRLELCARHKFPVEIRAVDARLQTCHAVVVDLGKHLEIPAVNETHRQRLTACFRRPTAQERCKRIVLSRRVPAAAANRRDARCERTNLYMTFA